MSTFHFEPSARLQRFLGRELIADPNVAVAEFVKNGYDAGAGEVSIRLDLHAYSRTGHRLLVADDGSGMDRTSFERNWMRPGFSEKAVGAPRPPAPAGARDAQRRARSRVPIGEKGVGRLAAGRLGERVDVYTRMRARDPWLHVVFEWKTFDVMTVAMRDIEVPYDEDSDAGDDMPFPTGTLVAISDLSLDWRAGVPGRKVNGRSDLRLGRLKEDLSVLVQPLGTVDVEFQVVLQVESEDDRLLRFNGALEAGEPDWTSYRYDFSVTSVGDDTVATRILRRSEDIALELGLPETDGPENETITPASTPGFDDNTRPMTLHCGAFSGHFLFSTVPWKKTNRQGMAPGIRLYRDGIRVAPYGDIDDDWAGARARKASRQGYALQPESMWGQVHISKFDNSALIDMSNRDGLVLNDAFEDFMQHVRAEFRHFAERLETEWLAREWDPRAKKRAAADAESGATAQQAMAQLYVHRLRGPLGAVLVHVQSAAELLPRLPQDTTAARLSKHLMKAEENVGKLDEALSVLIELAGREAADPEEFDIRDAVLEAIVQATPAVESRDIEVSRHLGARRPLVLPRQVVVDAIAVCVTNAAEVERPTERAPGRIEITLEEGGRGMTVLIEDDGVGMTPARRRTVMSTPEVSKGHMGMGLLTARQTLALSGGTIECPVSGPEGTTFVVDLPTMAVQRGRGPV